QNYSWFLKGSYCRGHTHLLLQTFGLSLAWSFSAALFCFRARGKTACPCRREIYSALNCGFCEIAVLLSLSRCGQMFIQQLFFSIPTSVSNGAIDDSQNLRTAEQP